MRRGRIDIGEQGLLGCKRVDNNVAGSRMGSCIARRCRCFNCGGGRSRLCSRSDGNLMRNGSGGSAAKKCSVHDSSPRLRNLRDLILVPL